MKNLKIAIFIITFFAASCVSTKKYNEALQEKTNLQQSYNSQLLEAERLKNDNKTLRNEHAFEKAALSNIDKASVNEANQTQAIKALMKEKRQAIKNLEIKVDVALLDFTPNELQVNASNGKLYITMSDNFLFAKASDALRERGEGAIVRLADVIPKNDFDIAVQGHTDKILTPYPGRYKDNWDLSIHRASTIERVFISEGIPTENIMALGENKFHPVSSMEMSHAMLLTPKTDIIITPKLDKLWEITEQQSITSMSK